MCSPVARVGRCRWHGHGHAQVGIYYNFANLSRSHTIIYIIIRCCAYYTPPSIPTRAIAQHSLRNSALRGPRRSSIFLRAAPNTRQRNLSHVSATQKVRALRCIHNTNADARQNSSGPVADLDSHEFPLHESPVAHDRRSRCGCLRPSGLGSLQSSPYSHLLSPLHGGGE